MIRANKLSFLLFIIWVLPGIMSSRGIDHGIHRVFNFRQSMDHGVKYRGDRKKMQQCLTLLVGIFLIIILISINISYSANDFSELDNAIKQLEEGKQPASSPTTPPPSSPEIPSPPDNIHTNLPVLPEINVPKVSKNNHELPILEEKPSPQPIPETPTESEEPQHSNVMEVKAMGHKGIVDVDARTRKVYRFDTIHNPPEFYRNNKDRNSYHLPKPFYKKDYRPIIFMAIQNDDIAALKYLHEDLKVPLNITDDFGDTPLSAAIRYSKYKSIKYLLSKKVKLDLNPNDIQGSAFYSAVASSNLLVIELLDEYGYLRHLCASQFIALWQVWNDFNTAILACIFNQMSQIEKNKALLLMICNEDAEGVSFVLYHKANANAMTPTGKYALSLAVEMESLPVIEAMLYCEQLLSCESLTQAACVADQLKLECIFKLIYSSLLKKALSSNCVIPHFQLIDQITNRERAYSNVFFDCKHSFKQRDCRDISDCLPNNALPSQSPVYEPQNCPPPEYNSSAPKLLRK